MIRRLLILLIACQAVAQQVEPGQADAHALLEQVRQVLPGGWEAQLHWGASSKPPPFDWMEVSWRSWLPGMDGRRIELRRKQAIEYWVDAPGPDPAASYVMKEQTKLRFALTLGPRRDTKEI